jgi:hypothetical protein
VMGISSVSRPKRNEVSSLRVDMGNPGINVLDNLTEDTTINIRRISDELQRLRAYWLES